jgi:hypothetical protein
VTTLLALGRAPAGAALEAAAASLGTIDCWPPPPLVRASEVAARAWSRGDAERIIRADVAQRALVDRATAPRVTRTRPQLVIARSLAARYTLAAGRAVGAATVLLLDLPVLRQLAADLDHASARWPERRFLRRVRPPAGWVAEQEAEWLLADLVLVRGVYAAGLLAARGVASAAIAALPPPSVAPMARASAPTGRVRLAGLATARHGLDVARAACAQLGLTLVVRVGDGTEPRELATLPGIASDDGPVDAVLCPALCEAQPLELAAARAGGVPVVVSRCAALADEPVVDPFDEASVVAALAAAVRSPAPSPLEAPSPSTLSDRLRELVARRRTPARDADLAAAASCSV